MDKINDLIDRYPVLLSFTFFFIFWFFVLVGSGSMLSGYHYADDHQVIEIYNDLVANQNNIITVTKKWMINDPGRFKPVYYLYRVAETRIFGTNFNMRLAFNGLLAVLTSFFLFLFSRKIGFSQLESILFPLLSLVGIQAVIWWAGAINEAISIFLLSLSLIFMAYSIHAQKNRFVYEILFVVFAILVSLSKESFLLTVPALVFWKVWLYQQRHAVSWFDALKNNMASTAILFFTVLIEIFIIVKWVGTNPYVTGAGISEIKLSAYLKLFKDATLSISTIGLGLISLTGVLLIILTNKDTHGFLFKIINFLKELSCHIILFFLIIIPQIAIYSRPGFPFGRYIVPLILGYSIFLIYIIRLLRENNDKYFIRVSDKNPGWIFMLCAVGGFIGLSLALFGGIFLYSHDIRLLVFQSLGRVFPTEFIHILKFGIFALSLGVFIIISALILWKRLGNKLEIVNIMLFLAIAAVFYKAILTFVGAYEYALEGKRSYWLQQSVKTNTKPNEIILVVADPIGYVEPGYTTKMYLYNTTKREKIYIHYMSLNGNNSGDENIGIGGNEEDISYIIILGGPEFEQKFLRDSKEWLNIGYFTREVNGIYVVYHKSI